MSAANRPLYGDRTKQGPAPEASADREEDQHVAMAMHACVSLDKAMLEQPGPVSAADRMTLEEMAEERRSRLRLLVRASLAGSTLYDAAQRAS